MKIPVNEFTKKFWIDVTRYRRRFKYWAITPMHSPRPEFIHCGQTKTYGTWVRVPCQPCDVAVWGFETAEHRRYFVDTYQAEDWV